VSRVRWGMIPNIGIDVAAGRRPTVLNGKDANAPLLADFKTPFTYQD